MDVIEVSTTNSLGYLTLNRPEKYNAMGKAFWSELPEAIRMLDEDPEIRVVIIRANGKHFTSGLDLMENSLPKTSATARSAAVANMQLYEHIKDLQGAISAVAQCKKPTIAAIHGYCLGGGVDLIAACDIRISTKDAIFSIRETKIAIVADIGSLQRLPAIMPSGPLYELALTGRDFSAEEAMRWGLVNSTHDSETELIENAERIGRSIAENSPLAVLGTKEILRQRDRAAEIAGLDRVALWNAAFLRSHDLNEAFQAFSERRPPTFRGE